MSVREAHLSVLYRGLMRLVVVLIVMTALVGTLSLIAVISTRENMRLLNGRTDLICSIAKAEGVNISNNEQCNEGDGK